MNRVATCKCRGRRQNVVAVLTKELHAVVEAGDAATVRWLRGQATDADLVVIGKAERAANWLASAGGEER